MVQWRMTTFVLLTKRMLSSVLLRSFDSVKERICCFMQVSSPCETCTNSFRTSWRWDLSVRLWSVVWIAFCFREWLREKWLEPFVVVIVVCHGRVNCQLLLCGLVSIMQMYWLFCPWLFSFCLVMENEDWFWCCLPRVGHSSRSFTASCEYSHSGGYHDLYDAKPMGVELLIQRDKGVEEWWNVGTEFLGGSTENGGHVIFMLLFRELWTSLDFWLSLSGEDFLNEKKCVFSSFNKLKL